MKAKEPGKVPQRNGLLTAQVGAGTGHTCFIFLLQQYMYFGNFLVSINYFHEVVWKVTAISIGLIDEIPYAS